MAYSPNGSGSSGLLPPISVLGKWPVPNYDDPVTRSKAVLITSCALGSVMLVTVGARMWARAIIQRNAGLDDWIITAAMGRNPYIRGLIHGVKIPTVGLTVVVCLGTLRITYKLIQQAS
ncbi:hypothetical protein IG631_06617 [Alternaria alternata]|nr:hypothetical protein IG631_06617 [Alternaria alternata]